MERRLPKRRCAVLGKYSHCAAHEKFLLPQLSPDGWCHRFPGLPGHHLHRSRQRKPQRHGVARGCQLWLQPSESHGQHVHRKQCVDYQRIGDWRIGRGGFPDQFIGLGVRRHLLRAIYRRAMAGLSCKPPSNGYFAQGGNRARGHYPVRLRHGG